MAYNPPIGTIYHLYIANWVIIYHLPPVKGTRNNHEVKKVICFSNWDRYQMGPQQDTTGGISAYGLPDAAKVGSETVVSTHFYFWKQYTLED